MKDKKTESPKPYLKGHDGKFYPTLEDLKTANEGYWDMKNPKKENPTASPRRPRGR